MTDGTRLDPTRRALLLTGVMMAISPIGASQPARAQTTTTSSVRIGIVGAGRIGGTLGTLWIKSGYPVMFSSRHPEELTPLADKLGPLARAGTVSEALAYGDAVLIAVPYRAYPQLGQENAAALQGKVVLDAGNAVSARDGEIAAEARENGIGETSAKYLAGARIVRAFNTLGYQVLQNNAHRSGERMAIPIAGDDPQALALASSLVSAAGFDPVVVGPLVRARDFAQGAPLYGLQVTAAQLRQRIETMK